MISFGSWKLLTRFAFLIQLLLALFLLNSNLIGQDPVSKYIEFAKTSLAEDDDCQTRFATDQEIEILKEIRALDADRRVEILGEAIKRIADDNSIHVPIEYISHAVVGADAETRDKVLQRLLLKQENAFQSDHRLAIVSARVALDLEVVDQVPELLEPAARWVAMRLANSNNRGCMNVWQTKFEQLVQGLPEAQHDRVFRSLVEPFLAASESILEKTRANPASARSVEFRETMQTLQDVAIFINKTGEGLTDQQIIDSREAINRFLSGIIAYRTHSFVVRLRELDFDPYQVDDAVRKKRRELEALSEGRPNSRGDEAGDNEALTTTMKDLVRTIKPDFFKLGQFNRIQIPTEKLSMETGQELASIVVNKLKTEKIVSGQMDNVVTILELVKEYIPQTDAAEVLEILLPQLQQPRQRGKNYTVEVLHPICSVLQDEYAMKSIEKVLTMIESNRLPGGDTILASLCQNLEPDAARSLIPRVKNQKLLDAEMMLVSRLDPQSSQQAFSQMFKEARAIEEPSARLRAMSRIGLFKEHDPAIAQKCFEVYLKEFIKIADGQPAQPSYRNRFPFVSLPSQFKDKIGSDNFLNAIMEYKDKLTEWAPGSFTDGILSAIARDADSLTDDQAKSLGDIWAQMIDRDSRQHRQTLMLFSMFVQARPRSERAIYVAKMVPSVIGGNFKRNTYPPTDVQTLVDKPVSGLDRDQAKGVFLEAMARSSEIAELDFADDYLLTALARQVHPRHRQVAISATMKLLDDKNQPPFLQTYTNCLTQLKSDLRIQDSLIVFGHWENFLVDVATGGKRVGLAGNVLPLAELMEGMAEPEASQINARLLQQMSDLLGIKKDGESPRFTNHGDIVVGLFDVLARVKPHQGEKDIERVLFLLSDLNRKGQHPVSFKKAETSVGQMSGAMQSGASLPQLKLVQEMMSDSRQWTKISDGLKLINSIAKFVHADDAAGWYELAFNQFTNENADPMPGHGPESLAPIETNPKDKYRKQDMFQKGAAELLLLGKKLKPVESAKYFARLLKLKEFMTKKNRDNVKNVMAPLLANIAIADYSDFEQKYELIKNDFPAHFKKTIENSLLGADTDKQTFTEIAQRLLDSTDERMRQRDVSRILNAAVDRPIGQAIELVRKYGSESGDQVIVSFLLGPRKTESGMRNRATPAEIVEAFDAAESVGFVQQMIRQRNQNYSNPPTGLWEKRK